MTGFISTLDLFSVGIGPSSSHTVGPMRAGRAFVSYLEASRILTDVVRVTIELAGSLASTGIGHGTPGAVIAGLQGLQPETCEPDSVEAIWVNLPDRGGELRLKDVHVLLFGRRDLSLHPLRRHPRHPNALTFTAYLESSSIRKTYLSVGGGFIVSEDEEEPARAAVPFPFSSAAELLRICTRESLRICDVMRINEQSIIDEDDLNRSLDTIWNAMSACIDAGLVASGSLPGSLGVPRRAADARIALEADGRTFDGEGWLSAYALAVNEENAAGRRVVTAPTNGAAGIIPAVIRDHLRRRPQTTPSAIREMLLTAGAFGMLAKRNASISGAEVGCQGEVGSACAMAAAALCAAHDGSPAQIENAAEIAMEHHLGLTCDPVAGLVQIPCIERNAVAASTARTAARLALMGDGSHRVSFDTVVETMRQTGADMRVEYKETSAAGLAVNVVEC